MNLDKANELNRAPIGIWTPWAEVLCVDCHDRENDPIGIDRYRTEFVDEDGTCSCTGCFRQVRPTHGSVAPCKRVADACGGVLEQTGGMTCAAVIDHGDEWIVYTCFDGVEDSIVGIYNKGVTLNEGRPEPTFAHWSETEVAQDGMDENEDCYFFFPTEEEVTEFILERTGRERVEVRYS